MFEFYVLLLETAAVIFTVEFGTRLGISKLVSRLIGPSFHPLKFEP